MTIHPLRDYVLIEVPEVEQSDTAILLPDSADREPTNIGIIAALPIDSIALYMPYKVGTKVLFRSELFEPILFQGKPYLYGKQDQVIAIITD